MKIQKKEESVFSTSALDLFCSAMGVFMLLCFVIMPYYRNETPEKETPTPEQKPVEENVAVVTPSVTVAISWSVKNIKARAEITPSEFQDTSCDFDLYVQEILPGSNTAYLHDYLHVGRYKETGARLVADSQHGGSEAWVQPAVKAGEICDVFTVLFSKAILEDYDSSLESYDVVVRVLLLSGSGTTEEWELTINKNELAQLMLTKEEQNRVNNKQKGAGYEQTTPDMGPKKRIPLLRIKVGEDCSISAQPLPNSKLKPISK